MAAGRGIIGSRAGGMAEMLDGGRTGYLTDPQQPQQLAKALFKLLDNSNHRVELGTLARERILSEYTPQKIAQLQIASYQRAIQRKRALNKEQPAISPSSSPLPAYGGLT